MYTDANSQAGVISGIMAGMGHGHVLSSVYQLR